VKRLILFFVFVLGGMVCLGRLVPEQTGPHLLALVPRESFCVLEMRAPGQMLSALAGTPLGKSLSGLDWSSLLAAFVDGQQEHDGHGLVGLAALLAKVANDPGCPLLDTGVLALVPPEAGQDAPGPRTGSLLILGRLRDRNSGAHLISCLQRSAQLQPERTGIFDGYPVLRYQVPKSGPVYLACYRDILIISPVRAVVTQAITLARCGMGTATFSLFGDEFFRRTRGKQTRNLQLAAYVNVLALERVSSRSLQKKSPASLLTGLTSRGLSKMVWTWRKQGQEETLAAHVRFRRDALSPLARLCSLSQPIRNRELARVPAGMTAYFWSNWFAPASWWQIYLAQAGKNGLRYRQSVDNVLQKYLSLSTADLTSLFAYEWSVFVTNIKQSAFLPVPRLCLRLGMINPSFLAALLEKKIASLPHRLDIVADTKVISLVMAGGLMEPSYSFIDRNLWLFDGYDQVQYILQPGQERMIQEPAFQRVAEDAGQTANLQFFVRMKPVAEGLLDLNSWLGTVVNTPWSRRNRLLLDRLAAPLAKTLAGAESMFVSAKIQGNEFETQARLLFTSGAEQGEEDNE